MPMLRMHDALRSHCFRTRTTGGGRRCGVGCTVSGARCWVHCVRLSVYGFGSTATGLRCRVRVLHFRVLRFKIQDVGCRIWGLGFWILGYEF
jgi:hypothetical protein